MGTSDSLIKTLRLQYSDSDRGFVSGHPKGELFLKGPIPLSWIQQVGRLPGKALHVAMAIRWLTDMNYGQPIKISKKAMELFGFSNDACSEALKRLEAEGIIEVERLPGQKPIVTLK
jgi:hypothetical protein